MKKIRIKENALLGAEQMLQILGGDGQFGYSGSNPNDSTTWNGMIDGTEDYSESGFMDRVFNLLTQAIADGVAIIGAMAGGFVGSSFGPVGSAFGCSAGAVYGLKLGNIFLQATQEAWEDVKAGKARMVLIGTSSAGFPVYGVEYNN